LIDLFVLRLFSMAIGKPQQRSAAKQGDATPPPTGDVEIDPKLEWQDGATGYVIRLALPGTY
jgi:hypothetical protein